jgi:hypothetical protein
METLYGIERYEISNHISQSGACMMCQHFSVSLCLTLNPFLYAYSLLLALYTDIIPTSIPDI